MWKLIKINGKMIKVLKDGAFAGYLVATTHRNSGFHNEPYTAWEGTVDGRAIWATNMLSLRKALKKEKAT